MEGSSVGLQAIYGNAKLRILWSSYGNCLTTNYKQQQSLSEEGGKAVRSVSCAKAESIDHISFTCHIAKFVGCCIRDA
jgi:hypothetical protein